MKLRNVALGLIALFVLVLPMAAATDEYYYEGELAVGPFLWADDEPINNGLVVLESNDTRATYSADTDAEGIATFDGPHFGEYMLTVSVSDQEVINCTITIDETGWSGEIPKSEFTVDEVIPDDGDVDRSWELIISLVCALVALALIIMIVVKKRTKEPEEEEEEVDAEARYCTCGEVLDPEGTVCSGCGEEYDYSEFVGPVIEEPKCESCEETISEDDEVCPKCGWNIVKDEEDEDGDEEEEEEEEEEEDLLAEEDDEFDEETEEVDEEAELGLDEETLDEIEDDLEIEDDEEKKE
jgi:hypothetical protein